VIVGTRFVKLRFFLFKICDEIFMLPITNYVVLLFGYNKLVSNAVVWKLN
jgi:hypothetical protein